MCTTPPIVSNNDIKQALKNNMLSKQMKKNEVCGIGLMKSDGSTAKTVQTVRPPYASNRMKRGDYLCQTGGGHYVPPIII